MPFTIKHLTGLCFRVVWTKVDTKTFLMRRLLFANIPRTWWLKVIYMIKRTVEGVRVFS